MSVRISVYALDLVRAEEVAQMSLSDLLWLYSEQDYEDQAPSWLWIEAPDQRLYAKQGGVYLYKGQEPGELTRARMEAIPFLAQRVRDYIASESTFALMRLLDCFSIATMPNWTTCISRGHRRWWIGSFLSEIGAIYGESSAQYQKAVRLLQAVLHGYDCGIELLSSGIEERKFSFPLMLLDDPDLRLGIWTTEDIYFLLNLLDSIPLSTVFKPTKKMGIAPKEEDWNQWVWDVLADLCALKNVPYESLGVVTFIG